MESFNNNRYQLLFIDDEAGDVGIGQIKMQGTRRGGEGEGDQKTTKRNKLPGGKKAVQSKPLTAKTARKAAFNPNFEQVKIANAYGRGDTGHQLQLQLEQQLERQLERQLEQQFQQHMDPLPDPHRQYKERTVSSRIISNSNKGSGSGYARLNKAKHDRHSGSDKTGVKAVVKRNGGGAHNWGSVIEDIAEQSIAMKNDSLNDQQQEQQTSPQEQQQQQQQQLQQQQQPQQSQQQPQQSGQNSIEEDDIKYITVEEWRAKHVKRAKPIYNIRKAGEGEVNKPDWKKMTVLPKKKPQKLDSEYLEYDTSMYPQRVGRLNRVTDIEFKFKDDRRRSGYVSGLTNGHSMDKSEGETVSDPINMDDEIEFPTLG